MIRGCIFDLDGVVVDTARYHYLAWQRLARELGFAFSPEDNERLKGVSRMDSLDILLNIGHIHLTGSEKVILADRKNQWYLEYIEAMTPAEILPGVREFIRELKSAGMRIALGTASRNAALILEKTGLAGIFDAVVDGNRVTRAKPDPQVFLLAAEEIGLQPDECVVFEDAAAGIEAARRAGMKCVGVGNPAVLKDADRILSGLRDANAEIIQF